MKLNFRVILGLGLIAITIYDIIVAGFHIKHAIFMIIAILAILLALKKNKV